MLEDAAPWQAKGIHRPLGNPFCVEGPSAPALPYVFCVQDVYKKMQHGGEPGAAGTPFVIETKFDGERYLVGSRRSYINSACLLGFCFLTNFRLLLWQHEVLRCQIPRLGVAILEFCKLVVERQGHAWGSGCEIGPAIVETCLVVASIWQACGGRAHSWALLCTSSSHF